MIELLLKEQVLNELYVIQDRPVSTAMKIIRELPTIDLVRCGECKWWESAKNGWNGWCRKQIDAYATFYADDFCSYGERRADDNTIKANK